MKTIFTTLILGILIIPVVSAQNSPTHKLDEKGNILVAIVTPPAKQTGSANFLLSLNEKELHNKTYEFYTDSNATVAHVNINGNEIRLTGGPNAEHIMTYSGKGYTFTISFDKKANQAMSNNPDGSMVEIETTLVVYTPSETIQKIVPAISVGNPFRHSSGGKN